VLDMLDVDTIGGAVNVVSKRSSSEPEGYIELKGGDDSRLDAKVSFTW
jgi:hypothetical protein